METLHQGKPKAIGEEELHAAEFKAKLQTAAAITKLFKIFC